MEYAKLRSAREFLGHNFAAGPTPPPLSILNLKVAKRQETEISQISNPVDRTFNSETVLKRHSTFMTDNVRKKMSP